MDSNFEWQINKAVGYAATRPGYKSCLRLPDGKAQGLTSFTSSNGTVFLINKISDKIYISEYPFEKYEEVKI